MAPLSLSPKRVLLAGMLAGAVSILPTAATFGKNRARPAVLARPLPLLGPFTGPPVASIVPVVPEPPTDALFYDIPPSNVDPAWLATVRCDSAGETPDKVPVEFSGYVTWQNDRFPEELPTPTFLSIELQDASGDGEVGKRPLLYFHQQEISDMYEEGETVEFSFCAKVPDVEQYGLYARVLPGASDDTDKNEHSDTSPQISFAGLTDIEAGLKAYNNLRVRLFKAAPKQTDTEEDDIAADGSEDIAAEALHSDAPAAGEPASDVVDDASTPALSNAVEVCNFSNLQTDVRGVAARVIMEVPSSLATSGALPHPTVLTILLEEVNPEMTTEPLAVFSSDITQWYTAGEDLTAVLCAQIPVLPEKAATPYTLRSILNVGWNGYDEPKDSGAEGNPETDDEPLQKLRSGDYTARATVIVVPDKDSYVVKAPLVLYES